MASHRTHLAGRLLLVSALLGFPCLAAAAGTHILLVREDSKAAQQAAEMLVQEFERRGWSANERVVDADRLPTPIPPDGSQAVVALGATALRSVGRVEERPLVGALVSRAWLENEPSMRDQGPRSIVVLDQPAERWAKLITLAFPKRIRVGILVSDERRYRSLATQLEEYKHSLGGETVSTTDGLIPALNRLLTRVDVLLALPDPIAHNRHTVQPLLMTTYRARIPVIGYSESYLQAGCTIALYSSVSQIARQVVDTLQHSFNGHSLAPIQSPRYFTVGVNGAVARALGLSLPSAYQLQKQLRAAGQ